MLIFFIHLIPWFSSQTFNIPKESNQTGVSSTSGLDSVLVTLDNVPEVVLLPFTEYCNREVLLNFRDILWNSVRQLRDVMMKITGLAQALINGKADNANDQ